MLRSCVLAVVLLSVVHGPTLCFAQTCREDLDCEDANECTDDLCVAGMCQHVAASPQPQCAVRGPSTADVGEPITLAAYNTLNGWRPHRFSWRVVDPDTNEIAVDAFRAPIELPPLAQVLLRYPFAGTLRIELAVQFVRTDCAELVYHTAYDEKNIDFVVAQPVVFEVNTLDDNDDRSCDVSHCSLREAIVAVNALPDQSPAPRIEFSVTGQIGLRAALPTLSHSVSIVGPGAPVLAIAPAAEASFSLFHVAQASEPVEVTIRHLTIEGGTASTGGAILNEANLTLSRCLLRGNSASIGGAICNGCSGTPGTLVVDECTIQENHALEDGGGIANQSGHLSVLESTLAANTATRSGGAVFNSDTLDIGSSTLTGNAAAGSGGGLYAASGSSARLTSSTLTLNVADSGDADVGDGGGIAAELGARVILQNVILSGNRDLTTLARGTRDHECAGSLASDGYNLIGQLTTGCTLLGDSTGNQLGVNAMLDALAGNGGPTQTHALLAGSPAIDAGSCAGRIERDQRGIPRPLDDDDIANADDACDVGAYERNAVSRLRIARLLPLSDRRLDATDRIELATAGTLIGPGEVRGAFSGEQESQIIAPGGTTLALGAMDRADGFVHHGHVSVEPAATLALQSAGTVVLAGGIDLDNGVITTVPAFPPFSTAVALRGDAQLGDDDALNDSQQTESSWSLDIHDLAAAAAGAISNGGAVGSDGDAGGNAFAAIEQMAAGGSDQAQLMEATREMQEMNQSFNLQYLQLQQKMQSDNRQFTVVSNIMKTKHDTAKNAINNVRSTIRSNVLENVATIRPGHTRHTVTFDGAYLQHSLGHLDIDIGGPVPDTEYDRIQITGQAEFRAGARVKVNLVDLADPEQNSNPFDPPAGSTFDIVMATAIVDHGTYFEFPTFDDGRFFTAHFVADPRGPDVLRLTVCGPVVPRIVCPAELAPVCDVPTRVAAAPPIDEANLCGPTMLVGPVSMEGCAACDQVVRVLDTPPVLVGTPADDRVECDAIPLAARVTASDECAPAPPPVDFVEFTVEGSCAQEYQLVRLWGAFDACNNFATHRQIIQVVDTTPPRVDSLIADDLRVRTGTEVGFTATFRDNCEGPFTAYWQFGDGATSTDAHETGTTRASHAYARPGVYNARLTVTDDCGNADTETLEITVFDPVPGDLDDDGDADLTDLAMWQRCFDGPGAPLRPGCETADIAVNRAIDLADAGAFQRAFTGPYR